MASVNKVIVVGNLGDQEHEPDAAHEHGPALVSLPSTRYLDSLLSLLAKHDHLIGRLVEVIAVLAVLVMAVKR